MSSLRLAVNGVKVDALKPKDVEVPSLDFIEMVLLLG